MLLGGAWGIPPRGSRNMYGVLFKAPLLANTAGIQTVLRQQAGYWMFAPGAWLVSSDLTAADLNSQIMAVAPVGAQVFVFQAGPWWSSSLPEGSTEIQWVRANWPPVS